ncbi:MAG: rhomboid family intramembrane serine protease [Muribaculaceae bacterium]|nr:rhomboid family intramembrane serine protease [Muribaculaceae bacterium]
MNIRSLIKRIPSGVMILIAINICILVVLTFVNFGLRMSGSETQAAGWLDLPAGTGFLERPWTVVTYMFTQTDIWHAIFNMLWLYWFGMMFQNLTSPGRLIRLYLIAGLAGAAAYIAGSLIWVNAAGTGLEGASAAVMGIVTATACMAPDYKLSLFLFGQVKLKWIAIVTIGLFALGLTGSNAGAHIAHFGGVAAGAGYAVTIRYRLRRKRLVKYDSASIPEADARRELDQLLDKVRRSGYGSLTAAEQRRLFELSRHV